MASFSLSLLQGWHWYWTTRISTAFFMLQKKNRTAVLFICYFGLGQNRMVPAFNSKCENWPPPPTTTKKNGDIDQQNPVHKPSEKGNCGKTEYSHEPRLAKILVNSSSSMLGGSNYRTFHFPRLSWIDGQAMIFFDVPQGMNIFENTGYIFMCSNSVAFYCWSIAETG